MSLNWDISKVENYKEKSDKNWNVLESLIWYSLSIGLGKITQHNVDEWLYRINRSILENGGTDFWKREWIEMFIGLRTNVSTATATEFNQVMKKSHPERYKVTRKELDAE